MMVRKTTPKEKKASPNPRVAIRFDSEEDYALVHHAADLARLSMNAWMIQVLMAAAGKIVPPGRKRRGWKRQENRNGVVSA